MISTRDRVGEPVDTKKKKKKKKEHLIRGMWVLKIYRMEGKLFVDGYQI